MHRAALIVGGGPAGAAAAITLAKGGRRATILERSAEPADALCGGFLSWNTAAHLRALGVDPTALGARPIERVALFAGPLHATARLPRTSYSLSRRALDAALIDRAAMLGVGVERGVHVTQVTADRAVLADGGAIDAEALVLATGKHELRGWSRAAPVADPTIGLRWRLPDGALIGDAVELHLFAGGYAGLAVQEDGTANLCMAVRRRLLTEVGGDAAALLARLARDAPALAARLDATGGPVGRVQAVANVPYGWRADAAIGAPYRVGDQAAVIPSLAGEGIAIALTSGVAAARAIMSGREPAEHQRDQRRACRRPLSVAGLVWHLAEARGGSRALVRVAAAMPGSAALLARLTRVPQVQ